MRQPFTITTITDTEVAIEILTAFDKTLPVLSDTETDGLYGPVRLLQVYQPEHSEVIYLIDFDACNITQVLQHLQPLWTVWHGASYDFGCLNMTTDKFDDTLYLSKLAYPEWGQFKLNLVADRFLPESLYEGINKADMQKSGFLLGTYLSKQQKVYAALDVYALSLIFKDPKIQKAREVLAYKIDILSLKYSVSYQQNGLLVKREAVEEELIKAVKTRDALALVLKDLNPNSPKQVKKAFLDLTGEEPASTNKSFLIRQIAAGGEIGSLAEAVFKQRRIRLRITNLNKYNRPKVYTRFNPAGAATGRFTAAGGDERFKSLGGINAQNITRDLQYIFNQDTEDTIVVHADYSTAELRAGCSIMKDATMYKYLMAGVDLHKVAATLALGGNPEDIGKEDRQKGKAISFGFIFGMSAPSFVDYAYENYGVVFTPEEAITIKSNYQKTFPNIAKYAQEKWRNYKTTNVVTPQGHVNKPRLGTDAINHATQGCIAETVKLAIHYLVKAHGNIVLSYIYNVVHDAIYLRVEKGTEAVWADNLTVAMLKAWKETCKLPMLYYKDIPMPVEVEYNCSITNKYICKEVQ